MDLSVVIPVLNEAESIAPLVGEIRAALDGLVDYEIVYVDDGSEDATAAEIVRLGATVPRLRLLRHRSCCGQSAAIRSGVKAARGAWIATLDGDGQNDPADIPRLWRDETPDTGCGLKLFPRALYLELPYFDHMHRFLPALVLREGGRVRSVAVNHRPRQRGVSNYGVFDRLGVGIVDLFGVIWLRRRAARPDLVAEAPRKAPAAPVLR